MKSTLSTIVAIAMLFVSSSVFGQKTAENEPSTMKTANAEKQVYSYTYKVDTERIATKKKTNAAPVAGTTIEKDVAYYDEFIKALEIKREYVMNNPKEKQIAEESGWFVQIDNTIAEAKNERNKLLQK
jgi:hypothetical protein